MREKIEVRQKHDNNTYQIRRTITEEVKPNDLRKIYDEISEALKKIKQDITEIPKQAETRLETLKKEQKTLQTRKEAFQQHAKKIEPPKKQNQ